MTASARAFIGLTASVGIVAIAYAMLHWTSADPVRFVCYLAVALLASGLKVSLPGINGSMSVNFLFILLGIVELSYPETLVIGCAAALVQCFWGVNGSVKPVHVLFNVCSMMATAVACSYLV